MIDHGSLQKLRLFGAWCILFYMILLCTGWAILAGMIPPPPPSWGPEEVAAFIDENRGGIRWGLLLVFIAAAAYIPFTATATYHISKVEGHVGVLSIWMLLGGFACASFTMAAPHWWLLASFRPEASPELVRFAHDAGWLQFMGVQSLLYFIFIAIAVTALVDKSETPLFPRWVGYLCILNVFGTCPAMFVFLFHSGPFAWNGIIAFWVPMTLFGPVSFAIFWYVRKAVLRDSVPQSSKVPKPLPE